MLNILKNIFEKKETVISDSNENLELLCGLMIEAANSDGKIDEAEIEKIKNILVDTFKEDSQEVKTQLEKSLTNRNNSNSLYHYTSKFNKEYSQEKKILLIETLWEIILSDGNVHDYETSLIRRLSGLLYISDVSSGNARKRALNKIKK